MSTILVAPSGTAVVSLTLQNRDSTLHPRAQAISGAGALVGSPVDLSHSHQGTYVATLSAPGTSGVYSVNYLVYRGPGATGGLATQHGASEDLMVVGEFEASDVWSQDRTAAMPSGSFGEAAKLVLGTTGKTNFRIDKTVYTVNGFLQTAKLRIFETRTLAAASTSRALANNDLEGATYEVDLGGIVDVTHQTLPSTVLGLLEP